MGQLLYDLFLIQEQAINLFMHFKTTFWLVRRSSLRPPTVVTHHWWAQQAFPEQWHVKSEYIHCNIPLAELPYNTTIQTSSQSRHSYLIRKPDCPQNKFSGFVLQMLVFHHFFYFSVQVLVDFFYWRSKDNNNFQSLTPTVLPCLFIFWNWK